LFPFILTWYVVLSELCPFIQRKSTHVIECHSGEGSRGAASRSAISNGNILFRYFVTIKQKGFSSIDKYRLNTRVVILTEKRITCACTHQKVFAFFGVYMVEI
jgi:hypothetical protein